MSNSDTSFAEMPPAEEPADPSARAGGITPPAGSDTNIDSDRTRAAGMSGHAIIAGYGLPGRAVAEALEAAGTPYCVIERNLEIVNRCLRGGVTIIEGDAATEEALTAAGIQRAVLFAATIPSDTIVLDAVELARQLNPSIRILARCEYLSTGLKATRRGADEVVVAEQAVATEFGRLVRAGVVRDR